MNSIETIIMESSRCRRRRRCSSVKAYHRRVHYYFHFCIPNRMNSVFLFFCCLFSFVWSLLSTPHQSLATQLCSFVHDTLNTTRRSVPHREAYVWFIFRFCVYEVLYTWSPNGSIGFAFAHSPLCGYDVCVCVFRVSGRTAAAAAACYQLTIWRRRRMVVS